MDRIAEIFEALGLQHDVIHLMEGREEWINSSSGSCLPHIDDQFLPFLGRKFPDGPEKGIGHGLPFFKDEERVSLSFEHLMKGVGVALIEDLCIRIDSKKSLRQFREGDLHATQPFDREARGDIGQLSSQLDIESIGNP